MVLNVFLAWLLHSNGKPINAVTKCLIMKPLTSLPPISSGEDLPKKIITLQGKR